MSFYIINKDNVPIEEKGPYKVFDIEFQKICHLNLDNREIEIHLTNGEEGYLNGFENSRIYFSKPVLNCGFHRVSESADDSYIVMVRITFGYDMDAWIPVFERISNIKRASSYYYICNASSISCSYDILGSRFHEEQGNEIELVLCAFTKVEHIHGVAYGLISLIIASFSAPW